MLWNRVNFKNKPGQPRRNPFLKQPPPQVCAKCNQTRWEVYPTACHSGQLPQLSIPCSSSTNCPHCSIQHTHPGCVRVQNNQDDAGRLVMSAQNFFLSLPFNLTFLIWRLKTGREAGLFSRFGVAPQI